jgi:4'-phosphopantetheinyl transferase
MIEHLPNLQRHLGLWLLPLTDAADARLERGLDRLTADERDRYDAYTNVTRQREFALCRLLLRTVLERCGYDALSRTPLIDGPHGKPLFNTREALQFNLSHAQGMAVLVLGGHTPVGIDIEPAARTLPSTLLAPRYCHDNELQWLAPHIQDTASHQRHFLQLWVRKEAVLKARGDGVHGGPRRVDAVSKPDVAVYHTALDGTPEEWRVVDIDAHADYIVAVASEPGSPKPVVTLLDGPGAVI